MRSESERMWDKVIGRIHGERVDKIRPKLPKSLSQADYLVRHRNTIIELKTLEEDRSRSEGFIEKMSSIYTDALGAGMVKALVFGTAQVSSSQFEGVHHDWVRNVFELPLAERIIGAQKQIASTKSALGLHEACGVLVIYNQNHPTITIEHARYMLHRFLKPDSYPDINEVFYVAKRFDDQTPPIWLRHGRCPHAPLASTLLEKSLRKALEEESEYHVHYSALYA